MTSQNLITGIATVISLASLLATIYFANRARRDSQEAATYVKRANDISIGMAENEIRRDITDARKYFENIAAEIEEVLDGRELTGLDDRERRQIERIGLRRSSALEDLLNAYENACAKYIDKKIDIERFKKNYYTEIRNLFEPPENPCGKLLNPKGTSRYRSLWHVYDEWHILE